jgi:hypothetical protein
MNEMDGCLIVKFLSHQFGYFEIVVHCEPDDLLDHFNRPPDRSGMERSVQNKRLQDETARHLVSMRKNN